MPTVTDYAKIAVTPEEDKAWGELTKRLEAQKSQPGSLNAGPTPPQSGPGSASVKTTFIPK